MVNELQVAIHPMNYYKEIFYKNRTNSEPRISTGIKKLDMVFNGGLYNELYIMAAETSTGKSAFMMNIAQSIAQSGTDVLYFALEMGRDEFVARGISMISFEEKLKDDSSRLVTTSDVLYYCYDSAKDTFTKVEYSDYADYATEYFARYGEHLHIIEGGVNGLTVRDIADASATFKNSGKPVVVFIDYLQLIKADPDDWAQVDRKNKIDITVRTLKTLASQMGMPVFAISSASRASYGKRMSAASYKESGDTEYTGGVLLGWNWDGVTDQENETKAATERCKSKERGYRNMSLEVLKYRNSARDSIINLRYYPAYSYFEAASADELPDRKKPVIEG